MLIRDSRHPALKGDTYTDRTFSRPSSEEYRENYDKIFRKKEDKECQK